MCLKWGGNYIFFLVTAPLQACFYGSYGKWSDNNLCRKTQKNKNLSAHPHMKKPVRAANGIVAVCSPNLCMCESSSRYIPNKN